MTKDELGNPQGNKKDEYLSKKKKDEYYSFIKP